MFAWRGVSVIRVVFPTKVGVDRSYFAQDPAKRCERLSRPRFLRSHPNHRRSRDVLGSPGAAAAARQPLIALLLAGQLRTAEATLPFLEQNLVRASAPATVAVFAHVWAVIDGPEPTAGAGRKLTLRSSSGIHSSSGSGRGVRNSGDMGNEDGDRGGGVGGGSGGVDGDSGGGEHGDSGDGGDGSGSGGDASVRSLAALRRFPGLAALVVEDERNFAAIVEAFYDKR